MPFTRRFWFTKERDIMCAWLLQHPHFKTYDELPSTYPFSEAPHLLLKKIITETYTLKGKYPPPIVNTAVQKGTSRVFLSFFPLRKKAKKNSRTFSGAPNLSKVISHHGNRHSIIHRFLHRNSTNTWIHK